MVREDSSAPRATNHVVSRMNAVPMAMRMSSGGSSRSAIVTTEFTITSAAPTPASMLDRNRPHPPIQPVRGPMAIEPHVNTVPASAATVVMCL